jgi:nucleoside-diphosphate-sugar epimerase
VLGQPLEPTALEGVDVLIHAAYDLGVTSRPDIWRLNVVGTRLLLDAAREANVPRVIVISTMSAYDGTSQLYGRAKLDIERLAFDAGAAVIRPGLVYSAEPSGMAGALQRVTRLPLVPLVAASARQYPVHLDDLMEAVVRLVDAAELPRVPLGIASPTPIPFRDIMRFLATQAGRRPRFVPVPWQPLYWALRAAEIFPLRLPFRADSLLGLVRPAPSVPGIEELAALGVTLRPFPQVERRNG